MASLDGVGAYLTMRSVLNAALVGPVGLATRIVVQYFSEMSHSLGSSQFLGNVGGPAVSCS